MSLILDGTNGLSDVDGSAATPAIRGSDANTGVFFGTDIVGLSTGGTERVRVDASGNVGISATPSPWGSVMRAIQIGSGGSIFNWTGSSGNINIGANIYDAGGAVQRYINTAPAAVFDTNTDSFSWRLAPSGTAGSAISFTQSMTLDSSGNLLVGTTTQPLAGSHSFVNSGNNGMLSLRNSGSAAGRFFGIGPDVANNFVVYNQTAVGVYLNNGGTAWVANSDERLKTTLTPFENAAEKVSTLRAGTGRYLSDAEDVSRSFLIAQDVQAVLPEAVDVQTDEQGTLGLRYTDTIPLLVAAIQEQQAIITALTARVEALEGAQA
jgi:hypothetical protein